MTNGINNGEQDARLVYADIIDLPRPKSLRHPSMSLYDRAAQFAPFAALTGYEDMIAEETRITDAKIDLGEDAVEHLNMCLMEAAQALTRGEFPTYMITRYVPDMKKAGGKYVTAEETIRRVDSENGRIILTRTEGYGKEYAAIEIGQILEMIPFSQPGR